MTDGYSLEYRDTPFSIPYLIERCSYPELRTGVWNPEYSEYRYHVLRASEYRYNGRVAVRIEFVFYIKMLLLYTEYSTAAKNKMQRDICFAVASLLSAMVLRNT